MARWDSAASAASDAQIAAAASAKRQKEEAIRKLRVRLSGGAALLEQFLTSEDGQSALRLLAAARKRVLFGHHGDHNLTEGSTVSMASLTGEGIVTHGGTHLVRDHWNYKDVPTYMTKYEAAVAHYADYGPGRGKDPATIVEWLTGALDDIANEFRSQ